MAVAWAEIEDSLAAAWLLAKGDRGGMALFDITAEGFWRSFMAAVLVAPFYARLAAERHLADGLPAGAVWTFFGETIAYGLSWAAFPIAAVFLTRAIGLETRYVPLIVASNWAAVLQTVAYFAALVIGRIIGGPVEALLVMAVMAAVLYYQWFVVRTALDTSGGTAFGFVAFELILSLFVNMTATSVLLGS